jgi:photosystem II stability/assembly factor-like uncharacterized protein
MRRRHFIAGLAGLATMPFSARAQLSSPASPVPMPSSQRNPGVFIAQGDIFLNPGKSFTFTALVFGASDSQVTWALQAAGVDGTITSTGASSASYTAPMTPGTYHVVATSAALNKVDSVTVTVAVGAPSWQNITPPVSLDSNNPPSNYGTQQVLSSPSQPTTLYVGTNYQGIWKSINSGKSWFKANVGLPSNPKLIYFYNNGRPAGDGSAGCASLDDGRNWAMAIDPIDADVVYTADGYGCAQGIWKTTNGGATWRQMFPPDVLNRTTNDIGSIVMDPNDRRHLLVGCHSGWKSNPGGAGVWETKDGAETWILHPLPLGAGPTNHAVLFIDSATWILATQAYGLWRTADSGSSWSKVSDYTRSHGGSGLYQTKNGVLYLGCEGRVLRSTDLGVTWSDAGAPHTQDGYKSVIGDGNFIYTAFGNTGTSTVGPVKYYCSPESDGTTWSPYNDQTFLNGPDSLVFDSQHGILYSGNGLGGVWKLVVRR